MYGLCYYYNYKRISWDQHLIVSAVVIGSIKIPGNECSGAIKYRDPIRYSNLGGNKPQNRVF